MSKLLSERKNKAKKVSAEDCILDLRNLQEDHPDKHISRNFYRANGSYSDSTWSEFFGTFTEFKRQSELQLTRHQHKLEQEIAKHAAHDHYKVFFETEVLPYYNKYQKKDKPGHLKSIMVCSDLHDLEIDLFAWAVFVDTARRMQPDIIVFNGDIFDLYEFSNFQKDPREIKIKERFEFVREMIFRQVREACPNAQIDFVMGNHEFRLLRHIADRSPNLRVLLSDVMNIGFAEIFGLDEFQINWVSKVDFKAYSDKDKKRELKKNYKIYYESFVVSHEPEQSLKGLSGTNGHHHQAHLQSYWDVLRGALTWTQTPGMHQLHAEYIGGGAKWNLGFVIAHINILTKQVIQEVVHIHEDWASVNGIFYKRND